MAVAALGLWTLIGPQAAQARDCGAHCTTLAQYRGSDRSGDGYDERRGPRPFLRGPGREGYGGRFYDRSRSLPPNARGTPLPDSQIWAIARSRVPGRVVNARLHGRLYSFRIISHRGSIVDVAVDRFSGRVVSVRGGP
ncbi:MAG: PepSY domain-containing protein [Rhodospirillaceae bacterium]|nr:PepSY domain-containing protein [Rhodospirillaceae bacterium]